VGRLSVDDLIDHLSAEYPLLPHSRGPESLREQGVVARIAGQNAGSLDDEINERFELGIPETGSGLGTSFSEEEKELIEILRRDIVKLDSTQE
jgi:hypothetical protein